MLAHLGGYVGPSSVKSRKRKNYGKNQSVRGSPVGGASPFLLRRRRCRTAKTRPVGAPLGPWPDRGARPLPPTPLRGNIGMWEEPGGPRGETVRSMGFRFFCDMFVFVGFFVCLLPFFLACWANIAASRATIAPRWLNLAPKTDQHSPKTTQHSPKTGQHSPKMDQHSLQDGPTYRHHGYETLRIHGFFPWFLCFVCLGQPQAKIGQRLFKMG